MDFSILLAGIGGNSRPRRLRSSTPGLLKKVINSCAKLSGNRRPVRPNALGGEEEETGGQGGEGGGGFPRPARPQCGLLPPKDQRPNAYPYLGEKEKEDGREGKEPNGVEGHAKGKVKNFVHKGVEELAEDSGAFPPGYPAIQDIRRHPKQEKTKAQISFFPKDSPGHWSDHAQANEGEKVGPSHRENVTYSKREI